MGERRCCSGKTDCTAAPRALARAGREQQNSDSLHLARARARPVTARSQPWVPRNDVWVVGEGGIFTSITVTHFAGSGPRTPVVPGDPDCAGEGQAWDVGTVWGMGWGAPVHCVLFWKLFSSCVCCSIDLAALRNLRTQRTSPLGVLLFPRELEGLAYFA